MKNALNNILLPALFMVVSNIKQYCWAWIRCNNAEQDCNLRIEERAWVRGWTRLLTTLNNVGSTTSLNTVFINCASINNLLQCIVSINSLSNGSAKPTAHVQRYVLKIFRGIHYQKCMIIAKMYCVPVVEYIIVIVWSEQLSFVIYITNSSSDIDNQ